MAIFIARFLLDNALKLWVYVGWKPMQKCGFEENRQKLLHLGTLNFHFMNFEIVVNFMYKKTEAWFQFVVSALGNNQIKSNQIFHYTRCNTPKRVTSWRGPSPRHCARATQLHSKKCRNDGEPLATLCPI